MICTPGCATRTHGASASSTSRPPRHSSRRLPSRPRPASRRRGRTRPSATILRDGRRGTFTAAARAVRRFTSHKAHTPNTPHLTLNHDVVSPSLSLSPGAWLVRPQDVLTGSDRAADISLDDSARTLCVSHAEVREGATKEIEARDGWRCSVKGVHCADCKAFLGVRVKSIVLPPAERRRSRMNEFTELHELTTDHHGVRISQPDGKWLKGARRRRRQAMAVKAAAAVKAEEAGSSSSSGRMVVEAYPVGVAASEEEREAARREAATAAEAFAAMMAEEEEESDGSDSEEEEEEEEEGGPLPVDQVYLGLRYLRLLDASCGRPLTDLVPLLCRGCDQPLSYTDQLLCTRRRWGFGRGPPEPACFVNSLVKSQVEIKGGLYEEMLAQGLMDMSDVYCKCGKQVGYQFCGDKTPTKRNLNQVGRAGLVCSTFRVAPYQLSHANVYHRTE